jgi:hypothetical protein
MLRSMFKALITPLSESLISFIFSEIDLVDIVQNVIKVILPRLFRIFEIPIIGNNIALIGEVIFHSL